MTDQAWILIAVAVVVVVVAVVGVIALTSGRRASRGPSTTLPPAEVSPYEVDQAPGAGASAPEAPASETEAPAVATPTLERPAPAAGRMQRLRARLARSGALGQTLLSILSRGELTESDWEEIEETLLLADVGVGPTTELMDKLRTETKVLGTTDPEHVRDVLRRELLQLVDPTMDRELHLEPVVGDDGEPHPVTMLVVGVNGTGKTTTVGKLARVLVAEGHHVVLGAADTFRAAAADQLSTWGSRVGVPVVRSDREGADPAAVAFDAVKEGRRTGADVVLVDTAGRLQNKAGLMDELGKIKRVMSREAPVREVLLVLDATTGQNGMRQAQVFAEAVDVTGIVLTKLDGTAKGGIVVAVQRELGVPVKFVGLGEGPDDLAPFVAEEFVDALLS
ncbi:signal recognition particle-docking protein FtsY [Georgenia yuyongxinii]|uniref:Signal recognition particle receptor FtsY n=1 Tax=Georgenia yuyongxinii TaxID=2589797 RepID=A0A5B8C2F4_9MICO|nr:signal recognition particle-docking protein FtsY [Georgenia yuyongxinii]QDC24240.1 signal recognition particle-docking protein FtsY [Georgenia yuyongxinii]